MNEVRHYSKEQKDPKEFACGRKPEEGDAWSIYPWGVTCPLCNRALWEAEERRR